MAEYKSTMRYALIFHSDQLDHKQVFKLRVYFNSPDCPTLCKTKKVVERNHDVFLTKEKLTLEQVNEIKSFKGFCSMEPVKVDHLGFEGDIDVCRSDLNYIVQVFRDEIQDLRDQVSLLKKQLYDKPRESTIQ
jgi:hypothetical protein